MSHTAFVSEDLGDVYKAHALQKKKIIIIKNLHTKIFKDYNLREPWMCKEFRNLPSLVAVK